MRRANYNHTIIASYIGYITQAIINNFAPLLFLTFQKTYDLSLQAITLLVTFNFLTQLTVDLLAAKFVDRIGYRPCIVAAHIFCAAGLVGLAVLPKLLPPYAGLLTSVLIYAVGGGLLEVLVSPIVEACPTDNKSSAMSLLHSFYCWGVVAVILVSTVLFAVFGIRHWPVIACLWAVIPAVNTAAFLRVPIAPIVAEGKGMTISQLMRSKLFWLLVLLMVCSGASEHCMAQWASAFAESGLHVSKTVGDLAGPCMFAALMGAARLLHSKVSDRISLEKILALCAVLCMAGYVIVVLPVHPMINLLGCGICGIAVSMFWPGTFILAAERCPTGGTALFALLALAGDLGCTTGPTIVGMVSGMFGDSLKAGLAAAVVFPLLILAGIGLMRRKKHVSAQNCLHE